jgi:hypothetical protein
MPSTSSTTLSFFRPRMTGFCPCAPSLATASPGSPRSASPGFCAPRRSSSARSSVVVERRFEVSSAA